MPKNTKVKNKALPPTTIAIHGDGFDIDASFRNDGPGPVKKGAGGGGLGMLVTKFLEQVSVQSSVARPASVSEIASIQTMIGAFGVSLSQDQINALTPEQMILFDHLMAYAGMDKQPDAGPEVTEPPAEQRVDATPPS